MAGDALHGRGMRCRRRDGAHPSGAGATAKQVIQYLRVLTRTSAPRWTTPEPSVFGRSSLLNDVLMQIRKQRTRLSIRRSIPRSTDVPRCPRRACPGGTVARRGRPPSSGAAGSGRGGRVGPRGSVTRSSRSPPRVDSSSLPPPRRGTSSPSSAHPIGGEQVAAPLVIRGRSRRRSTSPRSPAGLDAAPRGPGRRLRGRVVLVAPCARFPPDRPLDRGASC